MSGIDCFRQVISFFKPADTEIRAHAGILADATEERSEEWVRRLASLKRENATHWDALK